MAEGTSEIAVGSDTGGSVRIPAALNGVVGFKPTARRVPLAGTFPPSITLDSIGPLARTVADCAATDAVMAGEESVPLIPPPLGGLKLGIPHGLLFDDLEPAVAEGFERSLAALEKAGVRLTDHAIDDLVTAMAEAMKAGSIASIEAAEVHAGWLADKENVAAVDRHVARPLSRQLGISATHHRGLIRRRSRLAALMDERLQSADALALPTVPIVAPPAAPLIHDGRLWNRTDSALLRNPQVANYFDLTSISLPMPGMALPAGLMLFARHGVDHRLLCIAAAVERVLGR